jgi:hypothetical protein
LEGWNAARASIPAEMPAEPMAWHVEWVMPTDKANRANWVKLCPNERDALDYKARYPDTVITPLYPPHAGSETTASASVQGVAEYHAWCGDISEEVTLRRAVSVMEDVLGDISDWEDKALAEAVEASRRDLQAMVDAIGLRAQGVMGAEVVACKHEKIISGYQDGYWLRWCDKCGLIVHCNDGLNPPGNDFKNWAERRVAAFGCGKEARTGSKPCATWCGSTACAVTLRVTPAAPSQGAGTGEKR